MVPGFYPANLLSRNQPSYGLAEMLTLRHYNADDGWLGFLHYDWRADDVGYPRRTLGRQKVREIIPRDRLQDLRALQTGRRSSTGKPDLFLYRDAGDFMFVEVKKGRDVLREPQYRCIAQIMATLGCPVDIVYVREERQQYLPRRHAFDLRQSVGYITN